MGLAEADHAEDVFASSVRVRGEGVVTVGAELSERLSRLDVAATSKTEGAVYYNTPASRSLPTVSPRGHNLLDLSAARKRGGGGGDSTRGGEAGADGGRRGGDRTNNSQEG